MTRASEAWALPDRFNMAVACADRHPRDKVALIEVSAETTSRRHTSGDLVRWSCALANVLLEAGLGRGDRVAIMIPQRVETAISHLAVYRSGMVAVPLSPLFGPEALKYRLADAEAAAVITDNAGVSKVDAIQAGLPSLKLTLSVDASSPSRSPVSFWDAISVAPSQRIAVDTAAEEPALLIYTSGTTGPPKGVLQPHRFLLGHLPAMKVSHHRFPQPGDLMWTPSDWSWVAGLMDALMPSLYCGVPVLCAQRQRFDPEWAFQLLSEYPIRNAFIPPTALRLMRQVEHPPRVRLRSVMSGGEVLGEEILSWARGALGVTVNEAYGQTEANLLVGNGSPAVEVRSGSMGQPYPGHRIEIHDSEGDRVSPGEIGEIVLETPNPVAFLRYWRDPKATREKLRGRWLRTGDLAHQDEDDYIWYHSRDADLIKSAGYRIGPTEVEEVLLGHPAVLMSAVIGVPDEIRGEAVKAFVVLREGWQPSDELRRRLQDHVRARLSSYQYPRLVEFLDALPTTTTGKIQRSELRRIEAERHSSSPG